MGGCRCSYRTCTVKSNTQEPIHMFHYPVFDKPRCHQWINNAQKLNFLDLKVSQLKNRVVCEHHFKDSEFMNFMKAKLKNDAIPTLDGPYCKKVHSNDDSEMFLINLEDIENDHLTNMEKRAHFSVKYGDFLTNDITDLDSLTPNEKPSINLNVMDSVRGYDKGYKNSMSVIVYEDLPYESTLLPDPVSNLYQNNLPDPKVVSIEYEELNINSKDAKKTQTVPPSSKSIKEERTLTMPSSQIKNNKAIQNLGIENKYQFKKPANSKVKILSEKKFSQPVKLQGELQTVSPTIILKVPNKRNNQQVELNGTKVETCYGLPKNEPLARNTLIETLYDENCPLLQSNIQETLNDNTPLNIHDMPVIVEHNNVSGQSEEVIYKQGLTNQYISDCGSLKTLEPNVTNLNQFTITDRIIPTSTSAIYIDMPDIPMLRPEEQPLLTATPDMINVSVPPTATVNICDGPVTRQIRKKAVSKAPTILKDVRKSSRIIKCTQNNTHTKSPTEMKPNLLNSPSAGKSIKSKVPSQKLAVIEEKRKYNMKLRDIINSCLHKLDGEPKAGHEPVITTPSKTIVDKKVGEHLSSDVSLPSSQENIISYLEARLQKTEDILLNKIQQNSYKIADLKKFVKPSGKKSVFTQTHTSLNEKKQLYIQISEFLTPEVNSMIYEELFLKKYSQKETDCEPSKKRRKRS